MTISYYRKQDAQNVAPQLLSYSIGVTLLTLCTGKLSIAFALTAPVEFHTANILPPYRFALGRMSEENREFLVWCITEIVAHKADISHTPNA
jgi:hypothetical protein